MKYKLTNEKQFVHNIFPKVCKGYPYVPAILPAVDTIIVLGDIHGDYDLALKMLKAGKLIKVDKDGAVKWNGKNTYVVQVGDQIDRCRPIGGMTCDNPKVTANDEASDIKILKLFTDLDMQARKENGAVISLLGNHELMNAMNQLNYVSYMGLKEFESYTDPENPKITFSSGLDARKYAFQPGNEYGKFLGCTRLSSVIIGSNLFVHAGIVDGLLNEINIDDITDLEKINIEVRKWLLGLVGMENVDKIINGSKYSMFWTRILGNIPPNTDLNDPRCINDLSKILKLMKWGNMFIGHTPQSFSYANGINSTCSDHIWRVDNGSSAAFNAFDVNYMASGHVAESRRAQVLKITNDKKMEILIYAEE